jgi:hypothetical protein
MKIIKMSLFWSKILSFMRELNTLIFKLISSKKMIDKFIDLIYVFINQMIIDDLTKSLIKNKFV